MNNKEFISALSRSLDVSLSEAQEYVNVLNSSIVNLLNDKDTLSVKGFGSFEVKKRLERVVTNPSTRQKMLAPPKLTLVFKPSPNFKETINGVASEE